ncbi:hypothetical protein TWF481_003861 [Arthrobotrys musiformis]|uniref:ASX DEUBAD domain-containing protein n=1 Tax=Arthrobotrys musiformis TaxID=47236 RepID=A0AAV9WNL4_9PEZI
MHPPSPPPTSPTSPTADEDTIIPDAPPISQPPTLHQPSPIPPFSLFNHYINKFKSPPPSPSTKRPATSPVLLSPFKYTPKRPRGDNFHQALLSVSGMNIDYDLMDLDPPRNTRERQKQLLRSFPPFSRYIADREGDYKLTEEEKEVLAVIEFSKMYKARNLVLTSVEKEEAGSMARAYGESLADADLPWNIKKRLQDHSVEKFELEISWEKIMGYLRTTQRERGSKLDWTDLGLPRSESVRGCRSMPNLKVVASVTTKTSKPDLKNPEDKKQTPTSHQTRPSRADKAADKSAKDAAEKAEKALVKRMLEAKASFNPTPRTQTPTNDPTSPFTHSHLARFNKQFTKAVQNPSAKDNQIREDIRRTHAQYNHEAAVKRQTDVWDSTPLDKPKGRSWEKVPKDQHKYYTFGIQELVDATPEERLLLLEHNECVEASGLRRGDFEYERNDPFGKDTYLEDNPLILPGEDISRFL